MKIKKPRRVWVVIRESDGFPMDVYTSRVAARGALRPGESIASYVPDSTLRCGR